MNNSTLSLNSALDVGGWSTPSPGRLQPERHGTNCIRGPGASLDGAENLAPTTGSRSPDCPALSMTLYRLSYCDKH